MVFQKLQAWLDNEGWSDTRLAKEIGVTQSAISRAKRGLRVLGMEHQLEIQRVTKKVSPADWADFFAQTVELRRPKGPPAQKKSLAASEAA